MALQAVSRLLSRCVSFARVPEHSKALRSLCFLGFVLASAIPSLAQFQQPFVFSTAGAVMTKNDQTGVLTPVPGSPFAPASFQTLDVQGRFLFGLGTNSIRMYQVNSTTGAFSEVPNSPFASANTNQPAFIAVEPTGQYIAVVNRVSPNPGEGSIETFKIDPANLALVPVSGSFQQMDSTLIGAGIDHLNRRFYVFLAPNPNIPLVQLDSELNNYAIDPQTGFVNGNTFTVGSIGRCFTMDPRGRFLVIGIGRIAGIIGILPIAADTGIPVGAITETSLGLGNFPAEISTEVTGKFIYATDTDAPSPPVHIFAIDPLTQLLTETASSPLPGFASVPAYMADPTGPFMYGNDPSGTAIQAYMTDPQTGYFTPVAGTTISAPGVNGFFVFSIPPGQQNLVGPQAALTPSTLSLGSITVGTPSPAQTILLTSTGDQALSLNAISITGTNANEFSETDNCQAPTVLQPSKACTISVIFTPSATGPRQAVLMTTDNAPSSPQSVQLSGIGVAPPPPKPAVTLVPGTLSFPTITQGTTSGPLTVTVTNSGNATLHITSVVVGGNNSKDFSSGDNCVGTFAANAGCTINVTFAPLAAGLRSETITLTDDTPDSPQVVSVSGNANPAFVAGGAPGGSTSVSVTAGQMAQYQLQLTPGPGYTGSVSFTCSGAPLGATCHVPSSVPVANGAPSPFTITVSTSGGAMLPRSIPVRFRPFGGFRWLPCLALATALLMMIVYRRAFESMAYARRMALRGALVAMVSCAALSTGGCGGGGAAVLAPPPIITPTGTSTIVLTPTAMSSSGQPLQLQPIQLTLTVK
jgi:hypothetical protein